MARIVPAIVMALLASGAANVATATTISSDQVHWLSQPTPEQIAGTYSSVARVTGVGGSVRFVCTIGPARLLQDCAIDEESPQGFRLAASAFQALALYHADDSVPTGEKVSISFEFQAPTLKGASASTLNQPPVPAEAVNWERRPAGPQMARYYPDLAERMNKNGVTAIQCQVMDDLRLSNCSLSAEAPAGFGFGDASLKLAIFFKAAPGTPIGERVNITINWIAQ